MSSDNTDYTDPNCFNNSAYIITYTPGEEEDDAGAAVVRVSGHSDASYNGDYV